MKSNDIMGDWSLNIPTSLNNYFTIISPRDQSPFACSESPICYGDNERFGDNIHKKIPILIKYVSSSLSPVNGNHQMRRKVFKGIFSYLSLPKIDMSLSGLYNRSGYQNGIASPHYFLKSFLEPSGILLPPYTGNRLGNQERVKVSSIPSFPPFSCFDEVQSIIGSPCFYKSWLMENGEYHFFLNIFYIVSSNANIMVYDSCSPSCLLQIINRGFC